MPIKTFRGKIADEAQDTITLHTNNGMTGYRIVKFELFPSNPGSDAQESVVKIFTVAQTTITSTVDFAKATLLAAGYLALNTAAYYGNDYITIFDNIIVNQDLTITHKDVSGSKAVNYYIELEQVKLDLNENTVATLKDIRNVTDGL
jgi:hypothetical protein